MSHHSRSVNAADFFEACFHLEGSALDLSDVRLHTSGVDSLCRAVGAAAFAYGADVFFRDGLFDPRTRDGVWLLAHEVAHVVQQRRGGVEPPGAVNDPWEREADAAADAVVAGRRFVFSAARRAAGPAVAPGVGPVLQRYMAWEHLMLGEEDPTDPGRIAAVCALLEELGRDPENVDVDRLRATRPGLETVLLPGSGLVVTLGELNILPDYLSRPADLETAPKEFMLPLIQSVRAWNLRELRKVAGDDGPAPRLPKALKYSRRRRFVDIFEAVDVDALGRGCGFEPWELYSSVVSRNASHFAPYSWYRWQTFHLAAREMVERSASAPADERAALREKARRYAGFADHFLQDSFAAGHLVDKTLVMQWYVEWLTASILPVPDIRALKAMVSQAQPAISGTGLYDPEYAEDGRFHPAGSPEADAVTDPQAALDLPDFAERVRAVGVVGETDGARRDAYGDYLRFLSSSVAQLGAGAVHGYLNKTSLVVAAAADGERFRIRGDNSMFVDAEGARHAAAAVTASRRAIAELLERGGTDVRGRDVFELFPKHVEVDGSLLPLAKWHTAALRELCVEEVFGRVGTRFSKLFLSVVSRRLGVPSEDYARTTSGSGTG